jgi:hypothetical protein
MLARNAAILAVMSSATFLSKAISTRASSSPPPARTKMGLGDVLDRRFDDGAAFPYLLEGVAAGLAQQQGV